VYRDVDFDVMKLRHDNFSFRQAVEAKNKLFNTLHFKGILNEPHNP
jgi:hypothetical protein